jgi:hypothetical protein
VCNFSFIVDNRTIISKWWFFNFYLSNPFFVAQKKKDGPTYGKRITKRGQQYKLGLDVVYVSGSKLVLNNQAVEGRQFSTLEK